MENFVLNLFSDQLSKIIKNFHSSQINANFLSGKGSITNVKLNVDLINDFLNKPPHGTVPFLEFTEITLTELRVEVTSYTNLKKAPIVLVIEEIYATAREPLEYHVDPAANIAHKKKTEALNDINTNNTKKKSPPPPQQYGLLHRILDNLSVKIKRIHLSFSSLGKFKTRRYGPWTPPTLQVCFDNVEWISVTETGYPGTPDMVWAHNELSTQQNLFRRDATSSNQQHRHRSYVIYKRLSMLCNVKLVSGGVAAVDGQSDDNLNPNEQSISNLLSDTKMDVHVAYTRRLRDAGVTGADMDVQIYNIDINLDVASYSKTDSSLPTGCDVGAFVHMLVGLLHCYYKDRSFVDPLLPKGTMTSGSNNDSRGDNSSLLRGFSHSNEEEENEEIGPNNFLPTILLDADELESSDESDYEDEPDEEHDEAYLAWKRTQEQKEEGGVEAEAEQSGSKLATHDQQELPDSKTITSKEEKAVNQTADTDTKSYKRKRKAVIVLASGAQHFEKLSFSLSMPRVNMKLCLPSSSDKQESKNMNSDTDHHHCLELLLEGLCAQCIWPQVSGEMGGHVQGSIKYCHILESVFQKEWGSNSGTFGPQPWNVVKLFPLLRIGRRLFEGHDSFALSSVVHSSPDIVENESFVQMEDRGTTWNRDRQLKGPRAVAFKSTISFLDETLTQWSKTNVTHEASAGELEVILDSAPVERLIKLFSDPTDQDNIWFDSRWLSGEWQTELDMSMIAASDGNFHIKDYIQPLPSRGANKQFLSSQLRSITAHLDSVTIRLPNPKLDISSFQRSDVIFNVLEATILVSKHLPSDGFLVGEIIPGSTGHNFPHDSTDASVARKDTDQEVGEVTKFRGQLSLMGCSLKVIQAHQCQISNIIAPTNVTIMMSLDQQDLEDQSTNANTNRSLILSVLVQGLQSNIELRSLYGALECLTYHSENVLKHQCPSSKKGITSNVETHGCVIVCIHVPEIEINLWGKQSTNFRPLNDIGTKTAEAQLKQVLLLRIKTTQFEFGMEFTTRLIPQMMDIQRGAVFKCVITSVLLEVCSHLESDKMLVIISMGSNLSESHTSQFVEEAFAFCCNDEHGVTKQRRRGFSLRSESESCGISIPATSASAVEIDSPISVDLNIKAIELAMNVVLEGLSSPVFIGTGQLGQTILVGSALYSIFPKLYHLFSTSSEVAPVEETGSTNSGDAALALFRMSLHQVLILIPTADEEQGHARYGAFGLSFQDVEIATGNAVTYTNKNCRIIEKNCGHDKGTWLQTFNLLGGNEKEESSTFYALRSKHSLFRATANDLDSTHNFDYILPLSRVNWSLPVGLMDGATSPPYDLNALSSLSLEIMNMGMPLSSLYFKLYKLSPRNASSDFSLAAAQLHNAVGSYHCRMYNIFGRLNAEVDRLKRIVWYKENERVGALALASCTASGWIRVGEDLSFSHRIFSTATFWRYWMVLDNSLLILYNSPGRSVPSYIIPLRSTSQLRSIAMSSSSSSNKASGIVGNHVQEKGFAVFDPAEGTGLFFVTSNEKDYNMWVQALYLALKKEKVNTSDNSPTISEPVNSNGTGHNGEDEVIFTSPLPPVETDLQPTEHQPTETHIVQELQTAQSIDSSKVMDDVDMEEVSLCSSEEKGPIKLSPSIENTSSEEVSVIPKIPQNVNLPMRERLALAKGKSKLISREIVGQKMSKLKLNANTKLSAARASLHDQVMVAQSSSQDETSRSGKQEQLRKKLANLDQSMTNTVRRLKIDEKAAIIGGAANKKVNQLSAAVKSDPRVQQIGNSVSRRVHSRSMSEHSKQRIGIGNESKPIRFDARETFSASSDLPLKVKSMPSSYGNNLVLDKCLVQTLDSLQKMKGSWAVVVNAIRVIDDDNPYVDSDVSGEILPQQEVRYQWKYNMEVTDMKTSQADKCSVVASAERTLTELLTFHTHILESIASLPSSMTKFASHDDDDVTNSSIAEKLSPIDRLRVAGSLLQGVLQFNPSVDNSPMLMDNHCDLIKAFVSTVLECYMPEQGISATKTFLNMTVVDPISSSNHEQYDKLHLAETFNTVVSNITSNDKQPSNSNSRSLDNPDQQSSLLSVIMDGYTAAVKERDEALASLATTSLINDNSIMQEQLRRRSNEIPKLTQPLGGSNDEDMMNICTQLAKEIQAKETLKAEINRLNERLDFEQKIAQAKTDELLAKLAMYENEG